MKNTILAAVLTICAAMLVGGALLTGAGADVSAAPGVRDVVAATASPTASGTPTATPVPTPAIGFSPSTKIVIGVGQIVDLDVVTYNVTDLYAWQMDFTSTLTYIQILDVQRGPFLRSDGASTYPLAPVLWSTATTSRADRAAETRLALDTGATGTGVIARVRIRGIAKTATAGSPVHIAARKLVDRNAQDITLPLVSSGDVPVQVLWKVELPFVSRR
jgi:hypothetical protein